MPEFVVTIDYGPGEGHIAYSFRNKDLAHAREAARTLAKEERKRHRMPVKVYRVETPEQYDRRLDRMFGPL